MNLTILTDSQSQSLSPSARTLADGFDNLYILETIQREVNDETGKLIMNGEIDKVLSNLESRIEDSKEVEASLRQEIKDRETKFSNIRTSIISEASSLDANYKNMSVPQVISDLVGKYKRSRKRIADLERNITDLESKLSKLQENYDMLEHSSKTVVRGDKISFEQVYQLIKDFFKQIGVWDERMTHSKGVKRITISIADSNAMVQKAMRVDRIAPGQFQNGQNN